MKSGFLNFNSGKLNYQITGTGQPLVFLHGFSLDHRMWEQQVEYFSKKYMVITYDLRGFGKSSLPLHTYSHYDDLHALLEHLQLKKVNLVGLSMGGEAALDFTLIYPDFVKTLTVIDSSLGGFPCPVDWNVHAKEFGIEKGKYNWLNHEVFETTRKNKQALKKLEEMVADYSGWKWVNDDPREHFSPSAMSRVQEITLPMLILAGEKDLNYFKETANFLQSKVKNSQKIFISDAGHMSNMESPTETNRLIDEFLTNNS